MTIIAYMLPIAINKINIACITKDREGKEIMRDFCLFSEENIVKIKNCKVENDREEHIQRIIDTLEDLSEKLKEELLEDFNIIFLAKKSLLKKLFESTKIKTKKIKLKETIDYPKILEMLKKLLLEKVEQEEKEIEEKEKEIIKILKYYDPKNKNKEEK